MRAFLHARGGVVSIVAALAMVALLGAAALAVDLGAIYLRARQLQGEADLAAMAAAQDLPRAQARAEASARASAQAFTALTATLGQYRPDPNLAPGARFSAGAGAANAVRVDIAARAPVFFAALFLPGREVEIRRSAIAAQARLASFQIGSRLLAVQGGVPNAVLSALTGSQVSLSVMDYEALAHANVDLFSYLQALRTRLDLRAATFDQVLQTDIAPPIAIEALADALRAGGDPAAGPLADLAAAADGLDDRRVRLAALFDLGPYGVQDHVSAGRERAISVSALDIAEAALALANGGRQVALNLNAAVPGLSSLTAWLAIGERPAGSPWLAIDKDGAIIVRTAQMRLYLDARVAAGGLGAIASVRLPIFLEAASAQARLADIQCAGGPEVTLSAAPSLGTLAIADLNPAKLSDFDAPLALGPAAIAATPLLKITGSARADLGGEAWQEVSFSADEIRAGAVKTVSTGDLASASLATLAANMNLNASALGYGVSVSGLTDALRPALARIAAPLDEAIGELSDALGVRLGQADLRIDGVRCGGVALVG